MLVAPPENKFVAWSEVVDGMLKTGTATAKEIEKNIERWVYLGMVIPQVHHFLSRLRDLQKRAKNH